MSWLFKSLADPAVLLLVVGQVTIVWALLVSHHGQVPLLQRITKAIAIPLIISGIFLGIYKTNIDNNNQELQLKILDGLQAKEIALSGSLDAQTKLLYGLQQEEETLRNNLKTLAASYDAQVSDMAELQTRTAVLSDNLRTLIFSAQSLNQYAEQTASDLKKLISIADRSIAVANSNSSKIIGRIQQTEAAQDEKDKRDKAQRETEEFKQQNQQEEIARHLRDIADQKRLPQPNVLNGYSYGYTAPHPCPTMIVGRIGVPTC